MNLIKVDKAQLLRLNRADISDILQAQKPIVAPLKAFLAQVQTNEYLCFNKYLNTQELIAHRAQVIDELLTQLWQYVKLPQTQFALLAVGGYGRKELHPHSDIDLLVLSDDEAHLSSESEAVQSFITLLWDLKLDIGHSVRSIDECIKAAQEDLSVMTNLLESRLLIGDGVVYQTLKEQIREQHIWPADAFFHAKWEEIKTRHNKHKLDAYNLEPNIKNAPGTLRDIQTISWVTARLFGEGSLDALQKNGFLLHDEYEKMQQARQFLWDIRYCLHMLTGREEDRLLFDWREQIVAILHVKANTKQLAIERLMRQFYRTQLMVREICDLLLLHFNQEFLHKDNLTRCVPVHNDFVLSDGYLQVRDARLFEREPAWLLKVFHLMANRPQAKGIHSATIRALRKYRHLIDEDYRNNPEYNQIFMQIVRNKSCVVRELSRMLRYGILMRYIPEFNQIVGWMGHDLLNVYTVETQTFKMIKLLRHFRFSQMQERFALAATLIHKVRQKEILYLAALLHKTGKGQEGDEIDHAAHIAQAFCMRHNLKPTDGNLIVWLVKNQRRLQQALQYLDLNQPDDMHQLAQELMDENHLNLLYLFTVANLETTNPELWTSWRAKQMNELYQHVKQIFRRGLDNPISRQEKVADIQVEALVKLQEQGMSETQIRTLWGSPGDEYFLREGVDNVVWQTLQIAQHKPSKAPLVAIHNNLNQEFVGGTQIFVYMQDCPCLFAVIAATLDQLNLNVQDARVMISEDEHNVLDTYTVLDEHNQPITDEQRMAQIIQTLEHALSDPQSYSTLIQRKTSRTLKHFNIQPQIILSNHADKKYSLLEVVAADRPGILAKIGAILSAHKIQIISAKILTEGERINDVFFIRDAHNQPLANPAQCEQLKADLILGLGEQIKAQSAV